MELLVSDRFKELEPVNFSITIVIPVCLLASKTLWVAISQTTQLSTPTIISIKFL